MKTLFNSSLPQSGWVFTGSIDTEDYGSVSCHWCGTLLRYVHKIKHIEIVGEYDVGVVCCERLTSDYHSAKNSEKNLKKRTRKIKSWIDSKKWKASENGNIYRKDDNILIYSKDHSWMLKIHEKWGKVHFKSITEAKIAAFKYLNQQAT